MKLVDLLVQELPALGGWPANISYIAQDEGPSTWGFCYKPEKDSDGEWMDASESGYEMEIGRIGAADDCNTSVVSRKQYDAALAASKAVVGHDGWIQWGGGECPVDSDAIVEVKFRNPSRNKFNNDRAGDFTWSHDGFGGDIIAYRLQKPGIKSRANDDRLEQDLNECIGASEERAWDGGCLPPVGCECEVSVNGGLSWCTYRAISEKDGLRLIEIGNLTEEFQNNNWTFRQIRTEAERKRDEAIEAILSDMRTIPCDLSLRDEVAVIYDAIAAGKIPGVKLEEK